MTVTLSGEGLSIPDIAAVSRGASVRITEDPEVRPGSAGWESIGTLADRKKENTIAAKPWAGEKLPMRAPTAAPAERLVVFRDEVGPMFALYIWDSN